MNRQTSATKNMRQQVSGPACLPGSDGWVQGSCTIRSQRPTGLLDPGESEQPQSAAAIIVQQFADIPHPTTAQIAATVSAAMCRDQVSRRSRRCRIRDT